MLCSEFVKVNAFVGKVFIWKVGKEEGSILLRQDKGGQISQPEGGRNAVGGKSIQEET